MTSEHIKTNILVVDTETSGFDPDRHAVIEIGAVMIDRVTWAVVDEFTTRVPFWHKAIWEPGAERVHGITRASLADAPPRAIGSLYQWINQRRVQLAGWNVAFDASFLRAASLRDGWDKDWRHIDFHPWDIWTGYEALFLAGFSEWRPSSLQSWCEHYKVSRGQFHGALEDARITAEALRVLVGQTPYAVWPLKTALPAKPETVTPFRDAEVRPPTPFIARDVAEVFA